MRVGARIHEDDLAADFLTHASRSTVTKRQGPRRGTDRGFALKHYDLRVADRGGVCLLEFSPVGRAIVSLAASAPAAGRSRGQLGLQIVGHRHQLRQ